MPNVPLIWSEFNASYKNEPSVTDSIYMGPWLADTIRQCDGLVDIMAYWTFSDVFEEQGVVRTPFYGGFGLIAAGDIPKPSYYAFRLLHKLGDRRIPINSDSALLTLRSDGTVVLAVWNYAPPDQPGSTRAFAVHFKNTKAQQAHIWRLDNDHGTAGRHQHCILPAAAQACVRQVRTCGMSRLLSGSHGEKQKCSCRHKRSARLPHRPFLS